MKIWQKPLQNLARHWKSYIVQYANVNSPRVFPQQQAVRIHLYENFPKINEPATEPKNSPMKTNDPSHPSYRALRSRVISRLFVAAGIAP